MTTVLRTLIISGFLILMLSIDILNEVQLGVNFVTEAEAWVPGPVGVGGFGVAGVARRTTRRVAVGTTAVVTSAAATTAAVDATYSATAPPPQQVVVVDQTPQVTPQSGTAVPIGTTILSLPAGCSSVSVPGGTYFNCAGVYYLPSYQGNTLVYVVVPAP
jgi:hypothetical protein